MVGGEPSLLGNLRNQNREDLIDDFLVERSIFLVIQWRWNHNIGVRGRKRLDEFNIITGKLFLAPHFGQRIICAKHDDDNVSLCI